METKDLVRKIKMIKEKGAGLEALIQESTLACLEQCIKHRNTTYIHSLYAAFSKGMDRDGWVRYVLAFGNLGANPDKASKADKPFILSSEKQGDLEEAAKVVWTTYSAPKKSVERLFDEANQIKSLLARLALGEGFKNPEHAKIFAKHLEQAVGAANAEIATVIMGGAEKPAEEVLDGSE